MEVDAMIRNHVQPLNHLILVPVQLRQVAL